MKVVLRAFAVVASMAMVSGCGKEKSSQSELNNVFGKDDRIALTSNQYPWNTIGKVFGMGCTGTLVHKDLVLTAAHCVVDSATKQMRKDITYFRPNYINGASKDESWISHVWWGTNDPDTYRANDWAILKLSKPLGTKYGWLGVNNTSSSTFPAGLTVAGYSVDFMSGNTAGIHHNCSKRGTTSSGLILHDCDTARGSSGGPALRMYDNKLVIVGINVAERRDGGATSLHLSQYEEKHANIVIPTQGALVKLHELIGN